ncbi:hypothetical protein E4P41_16305 [Geodermatophilus sp. DF01-2]|uniref:hypothetical protein n=1 Tax=Geodermatophilus sp. DF01-2 TaxID=2559610 RepID=UPI0010730DEF|nr:hypothetical protein [Geodermatophilus sp. DF01_2]TFV55981.1 hypothetical protein E4P41_16305 [Geodermatophilus sp. DF01_2]
MTRRTCTGGDHRPPPAGGACACGMVTRIPARRADPTVAVRELLAQSLDGAPDPTQAADRLLAALAAAGLAVGPGARVRLPA